MGVVVDLGKRLLDSFEAGKALEKRERHGVEHQITVALRKAFDRGVHAEDRLGIVAVLELISMGYSVNYVQVDLEYSDGVEIRMRFKASISDPRAGKVIDFHQLLLPFE